VQRMFKRKSGLPKLVDGRGKPSVVRSHAAGIVVRSFRRQ
jgi:hypothetical protein